MSVLEKLLAQEMLLTESCDSADSSDEELEISDAQQHWDESIAQLETAVFFVLCPLIGKMIGRKFAKSIWHRFVDWRWATRTTRSLRVSQSNMPIDTIAN
ncbi:Mim2 protein [Starmerella bacillaris]|uniref:Mim2 protein n=1 Tax=Starmerella bacillaris TaxID=1247836 RepID=A0AAV5RM19_STABA|nr:Mim2 protein [Starmerella bacillaris]